MSADVGPAGWPDFMTIDEAARVLRIGRSAAYELAREFLATGSSGLPVVRVGRQLRVPRVRLESWCGGPLTPPPAPPTAESASSSSAAPSIAPTPIPASRSRRRSRSSQSSLPFSV